MSELKESGILTHRSDDCCQPRKSWHVVSLVEVDNAHAMDQSKPKEVGISYVKEGALVLQRNYKLKTGHESKIDERDVFTLARHAPATPASKPGNGKAPSSARPRVSASAPGAGKGMSR